ncbi:hypothetical protein N9B94_02980 [Verrucomicrobia bacterium]|nr:hypothetical protein [Verrucomicrobiota bacterium]
MTALKKFFGAGVAAACILSTSAFAGLASVEQLGWEGDDAEKGLLLISEFGCANCHQPTEKEAQHLTRIPAPDLSVSVGRKRSGFVHRWLSDPESHTHSTMPNVMHGLSKSERLGVAAKLQAYLNAHARKDALAPVASVDGEEKKQSIKRGEVLYETIGCEACHVSPYQSRFSVRIHQLPFLSDKYREGGLKAFLLDPRSQRPSGKMPRVPMTDQEAEDVSVYLENIPWNPTIDVDVSESLDDIAEGAQAFRDFHCARCHGELDDESEPLSLSALTPLASLGMDRGCLSKAPGKGVPLYYIGDRERNWIVAALKGLAKGTKPTESSRIRAGMATLGCYSCHERDGLGGPVKSQLSKFLSSGEDMGDEGRFPPTLGGVGRKLQLDAMRKIISGNGSVRPYMTTRMPDFGLNHAMELSSLFATTDHDPNEVPSPRSGDENKVGRNMYGRALVGTAGLSCITCHDLGGKRSLGIRALDLAHSPDRLRAEWFRDYLIDPAKFRPGTRMPSFWPKGKMMVKGHGNTTARQIDSVWVYLSELDQSRLPEGMEKKGNYELKPKGSPLVFRTFMAKAGMHAVALGFEEGVHAAFDADKVRWVEAWKGRFLDAESSWDDRFTPLVGPLGESVVDLPGGDWIRRNVDDGGKVSLSFGGYRMNDEGDPQLLINAGGVKLSDQLSASSNRLDRRLKVGGKGRFWIKALEGKVIREADNGWINDQGLGVISNSQSKLFQQGEQQQLWLLLEGQLDFNWQW